MSAPSISTVIRDRIIVSFRGKYREIAARHPSQAGRYLPSPDLETDGF